MRIRRYISGASILGLSVAVLLGLLRSPRLPDGDGYSLSDWLQIGYGTGMTHEPEDRARADSALRHIGTNALPYLLRELGARHDARRWRLAQLTRNWRVLQYRYPYPDERRNRAVAGFRALGRAATPAVEQIQEYLSDTELRDDAKRALDGVLEKHEQEPDDEAS